MKKGQKRYIQQQNVRQKPGKQIYDGWASKHGRAENEVPEANPDVVNDEEQNLLWTKRPKTEEEEALANVMQRLENWKQYQVFTKRERQVYEAAILQALPERTVAKALGISRVRVSRIKQNVINKLQTLIKEELDK